MHSFKLRHKNVWLYTDGIKLMIWPQIPISHITASDFGALTVWVRPLAYRLSSSIALKRHLVKSCQLAIAFKQVLIESFNFPSFCNTLSLNYKGYYNALAETSVTFNLKSIVSDHTHMIWAVWYGPYRSLNMLWTGIITGLLQERPT